MLARLGRGDFLKDGDLPSGVNYNVNEIHFFSCELPSNARALPLQHFFTQSLFKLLMVC